MGCRDTAAIRSGSRNRPDPQVSFLGCFVWADRLQSLGSFGVRLMIERGCDDLEADLKRKK